MKEHDTVLSEKEAIRYRRRYRLATLAGVLCFVGLWIWRFVPLLKRPDGTSLPTGVIWGFPIIMTPLLFGFTELIGRYFIQLRRDDRPIPDQDNKK